MPDLKNQSTILLAKAEGKQNITVEEIQKRYNRLLDSIDCIMWEANRNPFLFSFVSKQAEEIVGYPIARWLTEPKFWEEHIYHEDRERTVQFYQTVTGENKIYEYRMVTADGDIIWLRDVVSAVVENNNIIKLYGIIKNITGYKKTEEALQHRLEFEKLISTISSHFIKLVHGEIDTAINYALGSLGNFTEVDSCCIYLFEKNMIGLEFNYEWHRQTKDTEKSISTLFFKQCIEQIKNKEIVYVSSVHHLTNISEELQAEKKFLLEHNIKSTIKIPLLYQNSVVGCLGLDSTQNEKIWTDDDIALLKIISEIFVGALEHKQRETELHLSEERFHQVISSISDHIYVTEVTKDGQHINLYLSIHIEALTGYPLEKFISDWSFWPSVVIHPDDREYAATQLKKLLQGQNSEMEYRIVKANGETIWVRDSGRVQVEGDSKFIYGLVSDITERKKLELERMWLTNELRSINQTLDERVHARTAELEAILDAAGEGIIVTDLNGRIQYVNPALERMTGYNEKESLHQTPRLWKSNQHNNDFYTQMWNTILAGQSWRGEVVNRCKDGTLYNAILTINPIPNINNQPSGFVGVQSDITPFKEMDRMKSEFISTAAHELRTPLTTILGFSELLLTRKLSDEQTKRYLTFINKQSKALNAIISDLLDLSRLESGQSFEMVVGLVNIKELIDDIIFGFQENYPEHQYKITGLENCHLLYGDKGKFAQLFKNLFSNATKYSTKGGEITVEATCEKEYGLLHLKLSDHGIGMLPEQVAHIFERFYRADASDTAVGGTGLGMTISKLIVEQHKGKIWVDSEYGVGTTVNITFPLPDRPLYILIIEDDAMLRRMEQKSLKNNGYSVLTAGEGQEGLKLAQKYFPNLILLDLHLPIMDGFTVLERLQANYLTADIPIIITSAMDRPEDIERAIKLGATDYQVKPYMMSDLTIRISWVLNKTSR